MVERVVKPGPLGAAGRRAGARPKRLQGLAPRAPPRGLLLCAVEGGCEAVSVAVCEPARGWSYARARLGVYVRSRVWGVCVCVCVCVKLTVTKAVVPP